MKRSNAKDIWDFCLGGFKGDFIVFYRYRSIKAKPRLSKIKKGMPPTSPNQTFSAV
ncbi:hypothetical protein [Helicobacter pylori]|uniref:hypothetical protein n=1 Tax=Helicobacter pylori TaxID=210 RepID=UPI00165BBC8D|nr:hypothetical protein [Helicobacter pylori]MBH0254578.1 hypothetical protein [Helicobacter pylori]